MLFFESSRLDETGDVDQGNLRTIMLINRLDYLVCDDSLSEWRGINAVRREEVTIRRPVNFNAVVGFVPSLVNTLIKVKKIDHGEVFFRCVFPDLSVIM